MKLIQIIALTGAMAAVATGQTGANSSKTGGQPAAAAPAPAQSSAPAPAQSSAPASKPTPATKKAQGKAVPGSAKGAAAAGKTSGAQAAPAKAAGGAPATKAGTAPTVPVAAGAQGQNTKPAGTAAKSVAAKSAAKAPAPKMAAKPAPKPAAVTSRKAGGKKAASESKPAKPNVARVEPAPRAEPKPPTPAKLLGAAGRRDPFVSPIRNASNVSPTAACTSGKRCLNIPELVLQGTVRDISGKMMAVVTTSNRTRTYTLRENDQVFNGSVEKITSDSIIFREYVRDPLGRESAREVVKKLGPTT
jgi:Tfp pilus assembly protein PilP